MIGITTSVGNTIEYPWRASCPYRKYAELSGINITKILGLDKIIVLTEEHLAQIDTSHIESKAEKVFYLKLFIFRLFPEIDRYLYFDVDWNCFNPPCPRDILPEILNSEKLVVVRDRPHFDFVKIAAEKIKIDEFRYFNAGFYIANRKNHYSFFEKCIDLYNDVPKFYADQCMMNYVAVNYDYPVQYVNHIWNMMDRHNFMSKIKCVGYHSPYNYDYHEGSIQIDHGDIEVDQRKMALTSGWYLFKDKRILLFSDGFTDTDDLEWIQDVNDNLYIFASGAGMLVAQFHLDGVFKSEDSKLIRLN